MGDLRNKGAALEPKLLGEWRVGYGARCLQAWRGLPGQNTPADWRAWIGCKDGSLWRLDLADRKLASVRPEGWTPTCFGDPITAIGIRPETRDGVLCGTASGSLLEHRIDTDLSPLANWERVGARITAILPQEDHAHLVSGRGSDPIWYPRRAAAPPTISGAAGIVFGVRVAAKQQAFVDERGVVTCWPQRPRPSSARPRDAPGRSNPAHLFDYATLYEDDLSGAGNPLAAEFYLATDLGVLRHRAGLEGWRAGELVSFPGVRGLCVALAARRLPHMDVLLVAEQGGRLHQFQRIRAHNEKVPASTWSPEGVSFRHGFEVSRMVSFVNDKERALDVVLVGRNSGMALMRHPTGRLSGKATARR